MDPNYNQVRVRGANTPVNLSGGQEEPPTPPEEDFFDFIKEGSVGDRILGGLKGLSPGGLLRGGPLPGLIPEWGDREYGIPGQLNTWNDYLDASGDALRGSFNQFILGTPPDPVPPPGYDDLTEAERAYGPTGDPNIAMQGETVQRFLRGRQDRAEQREAGPITTPEGQTFSDVIAGYQFDGTPYDQAADYMMERREAQMRAVQDMYNQYAAETQSNVDRIGDIYGGAQEGVGQTYDSATGNIQDAYGSAQQQAADQMARLGIEEAAPKVIDPMALSQAEDLSSLETNRASTLGATEQFGATAGGFATNMAQVAQQGALENQRGATEQLADQLFELEMQRAQAQQSYNPYQRAMQELEAQQSFNQFYDPQPDPGAMQDSAEFLYRQEQDDATNFNRRVEFYASDLGGGDLEEKQITAYEAAMRDAQTGMFGPRLKAEADQYFAGRQAGQ